MSGCQGTSNVVCALCSKCRDGQTYAASGCDGTPRPRLPSVPSIGHFPAVLPLLLGSTQDTICESCSTCSPGTFYAGGCVGNINTICKGRPPARHHLHLPSNLRRPHRAPHAPVAACTPCPIGSYASGGCDGIEDNICSLCSSECPRGKAPISACTPEHDLVCDGAPACRCAWLLSPSAPVPSQPLWHQIAHRARAGP